MEKIKSALISVFNKEGIDDLCTKLHQNNVQIISTGGTKKYIEKLNIPVTSVESLTDYPSILGGRVKTLHPKVFGAILSRKENSSDIDDIKKHNISEIDMVIVDLYPFQETVESGKKEQEIIEKIDIGGVSLIRAAAKNFSDVLIVSSRSQYDNVLDYLSVNSFSSDINFRKRMAFDAFSEILNYDSEIEEYFGITTNIYKNLRYGENPHQKAKLYLKDSSQKKNIANADILQGKELSYNNIADSDAAWECLKQFQKPACVIVKHANQCGVSESEDIKTAYRKAFETDPTSAFGGIIAINSPLTKKINMPIFPKIPCDVTESIKSLEVALISMSPFTASKLARDVANPSR